METKDWVALAALAFTVINTMAIYIVNASKLTKGHVESHEGRLTKLESDVKALPSKDAFHRLELDVSEVKGSVRVLETELKPMASSLVRIENFLL